MPTSRRMRVVALPECRGRPGSERRRHELHRPSQFGERRHRRNSSTPWLLNALRAAFPPKVIHGLWTHVADARDRRNFGDAAGPHPVLILAGVAILGLALGQVRIRGVRLGVAGVLFAGIIFGHLGLTISLEPLALVRDFGLILFVCSIGIPPSSRDCHQELQEIESGATPEVKAAGPKV